jgi:hypothetical protein
MNRIIWGCLCGLLMGSALVGCAQPWKETPLPIPQGKGMSPAQLARYGDAFDRIRDDLYEVTAMTWRGEQLDKLCLAETAIVDGKLKIQTKTGCFSRWGLESRYEFRGNFDIQIDCATRFPGGVQDMDQIVLFMLAGKGSVEDFPRAVIQLAKFARSPDGSISFFSSEKGKFRPPQHNPITEFNGTLRLIRSGRRVTALYKKAGELQWTELDTHELAESRLRLAFLVRNFTAKTTTIGASSSMTVTFDNLVINAAEEIIEGEI